MKAIVQDRYGAPEQVLAVAEVDPPVIGDDQVLVRVHASAVAGDDWHLIRGWPWVARPATGLLRPRRRVPGRELAGRVEAVGTAVTRWQPGDEVFGWAASGAFAEHAAADHDSLVRRPVDLPPQRAAVTPVSAVTALQALRDVGNVGAGHRVLIIGASGGVGTFAVQIAKALGAHVTGVAGTTNLDLVRSLGADEVVDYTRRDPTAAGPFDLIVDLVGNLPLRRLRRALTPAGTLVMAAGTGGRVLKGTQRFLTGPLLSPGSRRRMRPLVHRDRREDLVAVRDMIEAGAVAPVLSAEYPLVRVPEAVGHFAPGHSTGKVAVTIGEDVDADPASR
jgi:NADPH:quinone reductase-like Zn-dependent oxidoreductase